MDVGPLLSFLGAFVGGYGGVLIGKMVVDWEEGRKIDEIAGEIINIRQRLTMVELAANRDRGK